MTLKLGDQWLDALRESRLLVPDRLAAVERAAATGEVSAAILARLVREEMLTDWQVEELAKGRRDFQLGKYRLLDKLGEGGMGAVYLARQATTSRLVAVKALPPHMVKRDDSVARFLREVRAVSVLSHANIVAAFDAGVHGETHYLVMEYVPGDDLWALIRRHKRLPIAWSCECIRQAAEGLQHAHLQGLIHRDIKPSNLLVTGHDSGDGKAPQERGLPVPPIVKILDLGLARFNTGGANEERLTETHEVMGTPDYMAPEQGANSKAVDIRADIYALGCTLFTMLAGREPFEGSTAVEKLVARSLNDAPPIENFRPEVSPELSAVIARMLARVPADRYQTPIEAAQALAPFAPDGAAGDTQCPSSKGPAVRLFSKSEQALPDARTVPRLPSQAPVRAALIETTAAADMTPPAAIAETPYGPQRKEASRRGLFAASGFLGLAAAGLVLALWPKPDPVLVLDLNLSAVDRRDLKVELNGKDLKLAASGPLEYTLPPGKHKLHFFRRGYLPYDREMQLERGDRLQVSPEWKSVLAALPDPVQPTKTNPTKAPPVVPAGEMPAELKSVVDELVRLNPEWDATKVHFVVKNGMLDELVLRGGDKLKNVAPVAALKTLTFFDAHGTGISDLTPMAKLPLKRVTLVATHVTDLSLLEGMELKTLWCGNTKVKSLAPVKRMPISDLVCRYTEITDLDPVRGMPLRTVDLSNTPIASLEPLRGIEHLVSVNCEKTGVKDLSVLRTLPKLAELTCDFDRARDTEILKSLGSLKKINGKPAADFWKDQDR